MCRAAASSSPSVLFSVALLHLVLLLAICDVPSVSGVAVSKSHANTNSNSHADADAEVADADADAEEESTEDQTETETLNEASQESPVAQKDVASDVGLNSDSNTDDDDNNDETSAGRSSSSSKMQTTRQKKLMRQEEDSSASNDALVQHQNAAKQARKRQSGAAALDSDESTSSDELISQVSETAPSALDKVGDDCADLYKIRGAESIQPLRMGLFFKEGSKPLWKNTNREYLYYSTHFQEWRIGEDYRKELAGVVSTPHKQVSCPHQVADWYAFHSGHWTTKFNITVSPESCPSSVTVSGAEGTQRTKMGTFYMTLHVQDGHAVYENSNHMFLYYWAPFQAWRIGDDWTKAPSGIASLKGEARSCPTDATQWSVFQMGQWTVATLKVEALGKSSTAASTTSSKPRRGHIVGQFGSAACPPGTLPLTEAECKVAANVSHREYSGVYAVLGKPKGCFQASGSDGDVTFNSHVDGVGSDSAAPLCKEQGLPKDDFEAARSMSSPTGQDDRGDIRPVSVATSDATASAGSGEKDAQPRSFSASSLGSEVVGGGGWSWLVLLMLFLAPPTIATLWMQRQERKEAKPSSGMSKALEPRSGQLPPTWRQQQQLQQLQHEERHQEQQQQQELLQQPQEHRDQQEQQQQSHQTELQFVDVPTPFPIDGAGLDMGADAVNIEEGGR
mmetsp:Transcript_51816/g.110071  ORF Transcript_51816/g.110071 Transcript_51816/m.110071 type:complete len:678 (+) Transcript_51816:151-2184(+)